MTTEILLSHLAPKRILRWLCVGLAPLIALPALAEDPEAEPSELLDRIELRSVVSLPGETLFSLHDPESDLTFWIERGQTRNGLQIVSFDAQSNRLTLRQGELEREVSLSRSRGPAAMEEVPDRDRARDGRGEARREQQRQEWREFRERWETAAENNPELQEITEHYRELRGEWQSLRNEARGLDRDSEEFDTVRQRARELRDEQRLLRRYASETITRTPGFTEEDVDRANRMLQGSTQRRSR